MFKKLPSIEQLHTISKEALKCGKAGDIVFNAKIKLHGTNACIRIEEDGSVYAQKRSSDITPENDNFGFAQWVKDNEQVFKDYQKTYEVAPTAIYIWGEWAGQGIQKTDAVSMAPKSFYMFGYEVYYGTLDKSSYRWDSLKGAGFDVFSEKISNFHIVPDFGCYTLNFFNQETMDKFVEQVTKHIQMIGECDPYIKWLHGIEGPGEGLVFTPLTVEDPTLIFKLKTEAHAENKRADKQIVAYSPETVAEINQFADKFVTEPRLNQALMELGIQDTYSIKDTGRFIGWVCQDIHKECPVELEASGLDWKSVAAVVTQKARMWFLGKVK